MLKLLSAFVLAVLLAEVTSQRFILPTYRPPPKRPVIIRTVRETGVEEPKWLYQGDIPRAPATGDHPNLPSYINDIKLDPNTRVARSLDSPSGKLYGGGSHTSSRSGDTGATHPGYNRRNTRGVKLPRYPFPHTPPFNPKVRLPQIRTA
ncbi:lebocin-4-like [Colias croceus]|uniref:lebocin-4-like n=1 Tax=Colias crocea TaxID=72248 RepID=UPI001E27B353|nr:lebocin-4-like [Colias croceus]XP_045491783.1 lebocin-4-like [Colias croceus]